MSWRLVFVIEYLGPIFIHPLLYFFLGPPQPSFNQQLTMVVIMLHFLKRELETLFLHRFSSATMPLFNIFKNSAHYWLLAGVNIGYWVYRPNSIATRASSLFATYVSLALFIVGELANLKDHITLRRLRARGSTQRGIPRGGAFELVTCPNYMWEITAWIGVTGITRSLSTLVFIAVAVVQMGLWAGKKEKAYRKEFGQKYTRKRWVMLPGLW